MRTLFVCLAVVLGIACSPQVPEPQATAVPDAQSMVATQQSASADVAYFAGGCFWGVEHYMQQLDGVLSVDSGYMGGHIDAPTYEQVASQMSGHLETVRVRFDSKNLSYEQVAKRFFEIHDPTQANGQGPDIGPEYRSAVFYTSDAQKQATEALIEQLVARGYNVVTELRQADEFWEAEDYHQDYYVKNRKQPYCHTRVKRFGDE